MTPDKERFDARSHLGMRDGLVYALLPMAISCASHVKALPDLLAGGLSNPDSYMRLLRLEEGLRHHNVGYIVSRDGSGAGTLLHWSHLLDMVLLLLAAPFRLMMGTDAALHAAAVVFGPLSMAALGVALCWAIAPLAERRWLWLAPVVAALSAPIASYGLPGVTHHHVPLLVVSAMTCGYALRGALGLARKGNGLAMGAWAGVGIWLSPESMPFTLMAFGGLWFAWLLSPRLGLVRMIGETGAGFFVVVMATFAVDPPYAGYGSVEIDRLSAVYVGLAIALACAACVAMLVENAGRWRMPIGAVVPALCIAAWLACFPDVLRGPGGLMSARDTRAMLDTITEMMPVRGIAQAMEYLLTGLISTLALTWFSISRRSPLLGYAALCGCVLLVFGAMHVRFTAYPSALAAAMLPILIARCSAYMAEWSESSQALVRVSLMAAFVLLPCGVAFSQATAATAAGAPNCSLDDSAALLADHAGQIVLANPNISPELLYRTHVLTVGSLYHRNVAAFMRLRAAWRSGPSDTVPAVVRATGASLVLFCPSPARSLLIADLPPDTLLDRLNQGHVPPWLHKLSEDPRSGNVLYEVMR